MDANQSKPRRRWPAPLIWIAILAAPIFWFLQLTSGYSLVVFACRRQTITPFLAASEACALIAFASGCAVLPISRGRVPPHDIVDDMPDHTQSFMGTVGIGFAVLFFLVIAGQSLAAAFLKPCP